MLKVALTGADGLVGSRIIELLKNDFEFIALPQKLMDITNTTQVNSVLSNIDYDIFLHLAAYTNVAGAESNKELALKINRDGTKNVFDHAMSKNKKFIYISTDFIFDGEKSPYFEDSTPNPISAYASTKYEGEKIIGNKAMIVRIAYPYRAEFPIKKDFYRTFRSFIEEKKPVTMIADSLMTPTFIDDIAFGLRYLFNNYSTEIFHLVGGDSLSPYDACLKIAEVFNLDAATIGKTTLNEYVKNRARLPRYSEIKSKKNNFYKMRTFAEGLLEIKKQIV